MAGLGLLSPFFLTVIKERVAPSLVLTAILSCILYGLYEFSSLIFPIFCAEQVKNAKKRSMKFKNISIKFFSIDPGLLIKLQHFSRVF
jgi:hypothetical protein